MLRALEYPTNLALSNLAWVVLALPVLTLLPALVALATALDRWLRHDEQRPFLGTFAAFLPALRRLWALSLVAVVLGGAMVVNLAFLASREGNVAVLLTGLQVPFALAYLAVLTALVPLAVTRPELGQVELLRVSALTAAAHPLRTALLVAAVAACSVLFLWPPLALVFGASVPLFGCLTAHYDKAAADRRH